MQLLKRMGNGRDGAYHVVSRGNGREALWLAMGLSLALVLLSMPAIVFAQQANDVAAGQTSGSEQNRVERPRLLFLLQRPAGAAPRRDDPYAQLSATLRNALDSANRYDIVLFGPDQPSVKRALLEHTIPVSDLVEPIGPQAFRRIAQAIGARYTLTVHPIFDKQGVKTEMRYDEDVDGENWRNALSEQIGFDALSGKHHLKTADLVALTVDAICARLNVPSHLAANIKVGPIKVVGTLKPDKQTTQNTDNKPDKQTRVAQKSPDSKAGDGSSTPLDPHKQQSKNQIATGATDGQDASLNNTGKGDSSKSNAKKKKPVRSAANQDTHKAAADVTRTANDGSGQSQTQTPVKTVAQKSQPARSTDLGPGTPPPIMAPAPARNDYVTLAMGARKDGDLSTAITFLRKAVTAAPHDANLRRQLIQAYQDRHMVGLALSEAERAIQLMPADNTLKRLYGDALLAKGDGVGALKIYREVVQRDPNDVAAQVALADALLADNQYADALVAYQTAAHNDPNSPLPHRRLARVYAGRAAADPTQYPESLKELTLARQLTPATDTAIYLGDYIALMQQMEQRLRDLTDELQNNYQAAVQGTRKSTEITRVIADLKERVSALAGYLDQVPPAIGHDGSLAHYQEGAALLVQAIGSFRRVLANSNGRPEDAQGPLRVARVDILHELATANKLLMAAQSEPRGILSSTSAGGSIRKPESIQ